MIQRLSHATIFVLDQDAAKDFYINKLGFEEKTDFQMEGGFRWLTVSPKAQPDLEIVLMKIAGNTMLKEEDAAAIRALVERVPWERASSRRPIARRRTRN